MIYLSYLVTNSLPTYGELETKIQIESRKSISNGDSSNSYFFGMENHWGTHIDAPKHFFENGREISDYPAETWVFESPQVISVEVKDDKLIRKEQIESVIKPETDFLILNTGFHKLRGTQDYSFANPGLHSELGIYLRNHFPKLRAVGIDSISISSRLNREEGRRAHQTFLSPDQKGAPIFLVEDMDLSSVRNGLRRIILLPFRIQSIDSAPCTILGMYQ